MKKTLRPFVLGSSLFLGLLASCAPQSDTSKVLMSTSASHSGGSLSGRIHNEVNAYRTSIGARPLTRNAGLDRLAQEHCEFLRRNRGTFGLSGSNVSHQGFENRTLMARKFLNISQLGENVVAATGGNGTGAPSKIVRLWDSSPSHRFAMRGDWQQTGIGVVVDDDGMVFATQLFGAGGSSQMDFSRSFTRSF
jgi:uncharacterized protein YkwD